MARDPPAPKAKPSKLTVSAKGHGRDVAGYRDPVGEVEKPHGKWNLLELVVQGDHVRQFVNGKLVNEGAEHFRPAGRFYSSPKERKLISAISNCFH